MDRTCKTCGKHFQVRQNRPKRGNYCCKQCYYDSLKGQTPWNKGISSVTLTCEHCGVDFVLPANQTKGRKYCSHECYTKSQQGKKRSEIIKKNISKGSMGKPGTRKGVKISEETKLKISRSNKGRKPTKESREKMSRTMTQKYINGEMNFKSGSFYSQKYDKHYWYRSSYELRALQMLNDDKNISSFYTEPFSIKYQYEEITRRYIPDFLIFYLDGTIEILEIKPKLV